MYSYLFYFNLLFVKKKKKGCQLWHQGRQAHTSITQQKHVVSASPIRTNKPPITIKGKKIPYEIPYPLLNEFGQNGYTNKHKHCEYIAYISNVIKDYSNAAQNAIKAGFDFIEIHGANGYLIDQFIQSCTNKRNDHYGGSINNRLRFMKEVVLEIYKYIEPKKIGIRLSPNGSYNGMGAKDNIQVFSEAIKWLVKSKIGYIHLMDGKPKDPFLGCHGLCEHFTLKMARKIVEENTDVGAIYKTLLIGNVGYTKDTGNEMIRNGDADLIAFGRPFISNPDLVYRFKHGIKLNQDKPHLWYVGHRKGYLDWPLARSKL